LKRHPTLGHQYGCIADDELDLLDFVTARRDQDQALQDAIFKQWAEEGKKGDSKEETDEDDDDWQTVDGNESEEDEEERGEEEVEEEESTA
jgi:hypothetical protein